MIRSHINLFAVDVLIIRGSETELSNENRVISNQRLSCPFSCREEQPNCNQASLILFLTHLVPIYDTNTLASSGSVPVLSATVSQLGQKMVRLTQRLLPVCVYLYSQSQVKPFQRDYYSVTITCSFKDCSVQISVAQHATDEAKCQPKPCAIAERLRVLVLA